MIFYQVTVVSYYPVPKEKIPNYRAFHMEMDPRRRAAFEKMTSTLLDSAESDEVFFLRLPQMLKNFGAIATDTFTHPAVEKLKREETFDLVVFGWFFNDYQLGIAAHFKCPSVIISTTPSMELLRNYVGNPSAVAYVTSQMIPITGQMSYKQRVFNFIATAVETILFNSIDYFLFSNVYAAYFPPDKYPTYFEAKKNVSLVLVTAHFSQGHPTPSLPAMIEVSGLHIKKNPNPLPKVRNSLVFFTNLKLI